MSHLFSPEVEKSEINLFLTQRDREGAKNTEKKEKLRSIKTLPLCLLCISVLKLLLLVLLNDVKVLGIGYQQVKFGLNTVLMKYLVLMIIVFSGFAAFGQKISGMVMDKSTREPIVGALVSAGNATVRTDKVGEFEIDVPHPVDSLKIDAFAYKTQLIAIGKANEFVTINLEPKITNLNEVTIYGDKSFKKDSLANRQDFAKQFNYKGPRVIDAFTNGRSYGPGELFSVNLLLLAEALTKKSTPEYKFNKVLVRDEHEQYVDEHFNRGNVSRITNLQGDTLLTFLVKYRPAYEFVLKSTDYDMEVYIKGCYKRFEQEGFVIKGPFVKQE